MVTYYRATARGTPNGVRITLETRLDSDYKWRFQKVEIVTGFDRAQEVMQEWQTQRNVSDYAWETIIDTRGS